MSDTQIRAQYRDGQIALQIPGYREPFIYTVDAENKVGRIIQQPAGMQLLRRDTLQTNVHGRLENPYSGERLDTLAFSRGGQTELLPLSPALNSSVRGFSRNDGITGGFDYSNLSPTLLSAKDSEFITRIDRGSYRVDDNKTDDYREIAAPRANPGTPNQSNVPIR